MLRKFYMDSGLMGLLAVIVRMKDLIAIPILTHYAGVELFGAWTQSGLIVAFAGPLIGLGLSQGFVRHAAGLDEPEQAAMLWALLAACAVMAVGVVAAVWILPGWFDTLLFGGNDSYRALVLIASLLVLVNPTRGSFESWFMIRGRVRLVAGLRFSSVAVSLLLLITLSYIDVGFVRLIAALAGAEAAIAGGLCIWLMYRFGFIRPSFGWFREGFRHGLPLVPGQLSVLSVHFMDRLFISSYWGISQVGVYAISYSVAQAAVILVTTPCRTIYEKSAFTYYNQQRYDDVRRMCQHTLGATVALGVPAVIILFLLSDAILALLAPPEFGGAGQLMGIIGASYLAQSIARINRVNIGLGSGTGRVLGILLVTFATNTVLNFLLIPTYALWGAALATLTAFAVAAGSSTWFANKVFPCSMDPALLRWVVWASLAMIAAALVVRTMLESSLDYPILEWILTGAVAGCTYAGVLYRGIGSSVLGLLRPDRGEQQDDP